MAFVNLPFTLTILLTFVLGTKSNGTLNGNSFCLLVTPEIKKKKKFLGLHRVLKGKLFADYL